MKSISKNQAKIMIALLSYDEIRISHHGYLFESSGEKVDLRSLKGLLRRKLVQPSAYDTTPSIGIISCPIFYDDSVTEEGKKILKKYVSSLPYFEKEKWNKIINSHEVT